MRVVKSIVNWKHSGKLLKHLVNIPPDQHLCGFDLLPSCQELSIELVWWHCAASGLLHVLKLSDVTDAGAQLIIADIL